MGWEFGACGGAVSPVGGVGDRASAWAAMGRSEVSVVRDVAPRVFEGALSIAFSIGPAPWTGAVDQACIDRVERVSVLQARTDPRPVLARRCGVAWAVSARRARGSRA